MEGILPQAILFLGIIPALILLYISLKGYEGYYKDKNIFLTFVAGVVLGFVVVVVLLLVNPPPLMIIYIILFAFFEQLFKTIILNIRRFQEKRETTIYGLSLGLGFGSVFTPFLIAGSASAGNDLYLVSLIFLGSIGIILFHGATGAYIGYGIYSGKLTRYLITAIMLQLPFNALMDMTRFTHEVYLPYLQLGLVLYGGLIFFYLVKKVMPQILLQIEKRKRSKKI